MPQDSVRFPGGMSAAVILARQITEAQISIVLNHYALDGGKLPTSWSIEACTRDGTPAVCFSSDIEGKAWAMMLPAR